LEHGHVAEGFKHRTIELITKVYIALETVVEAEVNDKVSNPLGFCNSDHRLLQGWDRVQRLALLRAFPILREFYLVQLIPLKHVTERSTRKLTCHDPIFDPDLDLVLSVNCMKMRRFVILIEHRDHDAEKAAQLRHMFILALALGPAHPA
jgi:hypothetical protein